ncbi:hypothetical protein AD60_06030 [Petrotoga sp. SL27]|nr:hypothetical protein AD60_06030 [Petrotoga sp. SL27]
MDGERDEGALNKKYILSTHFNYIRYEEIKEKTEKGEPLTDKDSMDLVFLPLTRNKKSEEEVTNLFHGHLI